MTLQLSYNRSVIEFEVPRFFFKTRTKSCEHAGYECATFVPILPPSSIFAFLSYCVRFTVDNNTKSTCVIFVFTVYLRFHDSFIATPKKIHARIAITRHVQCRCAGIETGRGWPLILALFIANDTSPSLGSKKNRLILT